MCRRVKGRTYARAGIPEYWIVNLVDRRFEVHREPTAESGSYARCDVVTEGYHVSVPGASIGSEAIAVSDILP